MASQCAYKHNAQIHYAAQESQLSLIHAEMFFHLVGACRQDSMIQIDEDIGEGH